MIDLEGQRVLVTGGSRGVGAASCKLFAEAGAVVAVHYGSSRSAAEVVLAELPGGTEKGHFAVGADLTDDAQVEKLFAVMAERWAELDCLVNNAGVWLDDPLQDADPGIMRRTWAVNVEGLFRCSQLALPLLQAAPSACIVNLASTAGQRGEPFHASYAASKGGVIAATKSWAGELGPHIRVNAVAPGWVDTDMSRAAIAERQDVILAEIPLRRVATAEDIAGAVLFLASPLARQITGEVINVNGGSVLCG